MPSSLIPLLRDPANLNISDEHPVLDEDFTQPDDGLRAPRGIMFGIALSFPLWCLIILGAYFAFR
jgi:hypothetical protein